VRPRIRLIAALAVAACAVPAAVAVAGAPDPTVTESLGTHLERTSIPSVLSRSDGSFIALQGTRVRSFGADGAPDTAFASPAASQEARLFPVAGGKILVLGYQKLTRLNPDGSVDTSFGKGGSIDPGYVQAAYELGSGKIAIVGVEVVGPKTLSASVHVQLLGQDGSVLPGNRFSSSVPPPNLGYGEAVTVPEISPAGNGGALVVGTDFLLKLDADGAVETSFGEGGVAGGGASGLIGGHLLPDGSIETVGLARAETGGSEDFAVQRFTATGKPEADFGPDGVRRFDLDGGGGDVPHVASWGADGSVVVGGVSRSPGPCPVEEGCEEVPVLAGFDAAGGLDPGFGQGGVLRLSALAGRPDGYTSDGVTAMTRRPDGSIVAGGVAAPNETTGFLAALTPVGTLLPGFGEGGTAREPEPLRASQRVAGLVPMPDGGVLAPGSTDVGIAERPILVRYGPDDTLDRSFGDGAGWISLFDAPDASPHGATGFAVDGEDVLVGHYDTPHSHLFMARMSDGSPVTSFGTDGTVDLPPETWATQPAFAGDGDALVLANHRGPGRFSGEAGVVFGYRPDGTLDRGFGHGGKFTMVLGGKPVHGKSILTGPGGRILVGGSLGHRFTFASLLPNGRPDPRFGAGGWAVVKLGEATHYLTLGSIGRYTYLAGTVGDERGKGDLVLMCFDRHGHLDRGFGRRVVPLRIWAHPVEILPTPAGPLVVLSGGKLPLVTFFPHGKVTQSAVGDPAKFVEDVRAAISGDELVLGWATYEERSTVYHLARRPLGRP